ncbi:MAG: hypothetical protein F7C38_02345 [Desulfurococcales archaeon]|nr:hypothetical protein [Desulfurococcales archaeon]
MLTTQSEKGLRLTLVIAVLALAMTSCLVVAGCAGSRGSPVRAAWYLEEYVSGAGGYPVGDCRLVGGYNTTPTYKVEYRGLVLTTNGSVIATTSETAIINVSEATRPVPVLMYQCGDQALLKIIDPAAVNATHVIVGIRVYRGPGVEGNFVIDGSGVYFKFPNNTIVRLDTNESIRVKVDREGTILVGPGKNLVTIEFEAHYRDSTTRTYGFTAALASLDYTDLK